MMYSLFNKKIIQGVINLNFNVNNKKSISS